MGLNVLVAEIGLEHLNELINAVRISLPLSDESASGLVWNAINQAWLATKDKYGIYLKFKIFIANGKACW